MEQVPQERNHWIFVAALTWGIRCTRDHMELSFGNGALLLLLVGAVVAMATRRLKLPYSVGLVVAGMALALLLLVTVPAAVVLLASVEAGTIIMLAEGV